MKKIILSGKKSIGKFALVDDEDFEKVNKQTWYLSSGYATNVKLGSLHRLLMGYPKGFEVDHKNGILLDCRKNNLRIVTGQQNHWNQKKSIKKSFSSIYKGVCKVKNTSEKKWMAYIKQNQQRIYLGCYETEKEAAETYNRKAKELFKEFASLNIVG